VEISSHILEGVARHIRRTPRTAGGTL
jgi:hypothetical protein